MRAADIPVFNLDEIGRELTASDSKLQETLGAILGPEIYREGIFDRAKARDVLFGDAQKRKAVEAVLHPRIQEEFEKRAAVARANGEKLVICEAALLMEAGIDKRLDGLILVQAPESLRSTRVVERDRIGAALAQQMIRAQLKDGDRQKTRQTIVVENVGSLADLSLKVTEILSEWKGLGWI